MDRELARELARRVVAQQAPDEQEAFDSLADYYLDDRDRANAATRGDAPLGAGLATAASLVTPAAIYVSMHVLDLVTNATLEKSGTRIGRLLGRAVKKRSPTPVEGGRAAPVPDHGPVPAPDSGPDAGDAASADGLGRARVLLRGREEQVRSAALDAGISYGLSSDLAERLADLIVTQLLVEDPAAQPPESAAQPPESAALPPEPAGVAVDTDPSPDPGSASTPTAPPPQSAN
jgi:hypothetical protein